jgi:ATP-binding cassette subfamily F protein uup
MPTLLSSQDLSKAYASHTLFKGIGVQLVDDDRLGVIGPNGAGKSTLLKILAGIETPDTGEITCRRGLRQVYVAQDDQFAADATPMSAVVAQLADENGDIRRMDAATRASIALSKLGFVDFDQRVGQLSGGWRKRLSLACALVREPDVLLLDEPTNHLDLEGILWLEKFMRQAALAMVFITHDRRFLENVARRIIELSPAYPGGTFEVAGNYSEFVRRKDEFLNGQSTAQSTLANAVRRDTAWLRQGIQARRTRNKTQVEDAGERRADLKAIKNRQEAPSRTTTIDFQATERKTKKLLALHRIAKSMGGKKLFEKLDLMLSPGRCIGLLGPNASGKTTLLRLMSGELEPDSGTIKRAADLRIVTFTQHRAELIPTQTLAEALAPTGDTVDYRGKLIHVTGWAKKFLFSPHQLSTFVSNLSGGERARVFIARLMLEPADVLLLDEPTNDLDISSLEVLEQALLEFPGAIVLVTHDRFMLESVSTEFLALDGQGRGTSYASIRQWQEATAKRLAEESQKPAKTERVESPKGRSLGSKKLSFKHQREFAGIEQAILQAEAEVESLQAVAADPIIIADHVRLADAFRQLDEAQRRVQQLYDRWSELDAMQARV